MGVARISASASNGQRSAGLTTRSKCNAKRYIIHAARLGCQEYRADTVTVISITLRRASCVPTCLFLFSALRPASVWSIDANWGKAALKTNATSAIRRPKTPLRCCSGAVQCERTCTATTVFHLRRFPIFLWSYNTPDTLLRFEDAARHRALYPCPAIRSRRIDTGLH